MRSYYPLPVLVLVGLFLTGLVSGQDVQDVYIWEGFEPIPDMDPFGTGVEIVIPAGKLPTTITDLDVDLIVEHNFQGDLSVTLTHADSGQTIVLMNRLPRLTFVTHHSFSLNSCKHADGASVKQSSIDRHRQIIRSLVFRIQCNREPTFLGLLVTNRDAV